MSFRVRGLPPEPFRPLFELDDATLRRHDARRVIAVDGEAPCRVSLAHATVGEELLLVNFEHQPAASPYRSRHAIYVRRTALAAFDAVDVVPAPLAQRLLSVRAFDREHMIVDAEVCEGRDAATLFEHLLADARSAYLHVHFARRGCYAARVERA